MQPAEHWSRTDPPGACCSLLVRRQRRFQLETSVGALSVVVLAFLVVGVVLGYFVPKRGVALGISVAVARGRRGRAPALRDGVRARPGLGRGVDRVRPRSAGLWTGLAAPRAPIGSAREL